VVKEINLDCVEQARARPAKKYSVLCA